MITGYLGPRNPVYEQTTPRPLTGASGWMLFQSFTPLAGLTREDISLHNVLKCRWKHSNELPPKELYEEAVSYCTKTHLRIPKEVTTIIAHGSAAWAVTQGPGYPIGDWRGYLGGQHLDGRRVFATLHTADCLRDPHARFISRRDWRKLRLVLDGQFPQPTPQSILASPASRADFVRILEEAHEQPEIMVDTEYYPETRTLTHLGAAWRVGDTVHGFQIEWLRGQATSVERALFARMWPALCERVTMGFWNAKADLPVIQQALGVIPDAIEDPMQAHACLWPDMDHDFGFAASLYGKYGKMKHLSKDDMLLYHWGDCIELVWIWEALKEEFKQDPLVEQKYRQQNLKLIPILLDTEARGIRVNQARIEKALPEYQALTQDAQQAAQAYCGYPINLGSVSQIVTYLNHTEGFKLKSLDKDIVAVQRSKFLEYEADHEEKHGLSLDYIMARVEQGAHPLLELRVMYATNSQVISHYLEPLRQVERCHPQINVHTQAAGRHSTTSPPLATVPNGLRDIVCPDEGTVWIGWDWDQQEPRIQRAESGSKVLGQAFDEGEDIHTTFVCRLYGWEFPQDLRDPHHSSCDTGWRQAHAWGGKEDIRRVFAKTTRYEINYGGDGTQAAKKAVRMGLDPKVAKKAAQVLLASDPELAAWFRKVEKDVASTRISRSWGGGRRVFYWLEDIREMGRKARNFPMQAGGSDLYNLTIVEVTEKVPDARFVYGMHDSQWYSCEKGMWLRLLPRIKAIAEQARTINGAQVYFPASWKVMYDDGRVEKVICE